MSRLRHAASACRPSLARAAGPFVTLALLGCADTVAPRLSGELTLTAEGDHVAARWPAATDDVGVAAYLVTIDGEPAARLAPDGLTYEIDGAEERTSRTVRVAAVDAAGNESAALEASLTIPDRTPPVFPADARLSATGDETEVSFTWTAATDAGAVRYLVLSGEDELGTVTETSLTLSRSAVAERPGTPSVVAIDDADNRSAPLAGTWAWNLHLGLYSAGLLGTTAHGNPFGHTDALLDVLSREDPTVADLFEPADGVTEPFPEPPITNEPAMGVLRSPH